MQNLLQEIVVGNVFAFLLVFMRFGTALMIMPGIGDSFVSSTVRALFAASISFILAPVLAARLPAMPPDIGSLILLILSEAFIGIFLGTTMRTLVSALDTAGTIVSTQAGLSNASLFNPATNAQTPILSAAYSSLGVTLIFTTGMDHRMLAAVMDSYSLFPASGAFPDPGSLTQALAKTVELAFSTGVQLAIPFLVAGLLMQLGFGVLGRLMPQLQVFFLALPLQIFLSLVILLVTLSASVIYWLGGFDAVLFQSLTPE